MKCKNIIGSNGIGILLELEDGRYAVVGLEHENVVIEILKESFLKWDFFDEEVSEASIQRIDSILEHPKHIEYGANSQEYLNNPEVKQVYDELRNKLT